MQEQEILKNEGYAKAIIRIEIETEMLEEMLKESEKIFKELLKRSH